LGGLRGAEAPLFHGITQSYEAALQLNPGLKEAAEALKRVS
jgi:hypothetical protein